MDTNQNNHNFQNPSESNSNMTEFNFGNFSFDAAVQLVSDNAHSHAIKSSSQQQSLPALQFIKKGEKCCSKKRKQKRSCSLSNSRNLSQLDIDLRIKKLSLQMPSRPTTVRGVLKDHSIKTTNDSVPRKPRRSNSNFTLEVLEEAMKTPFDIQKITSKTSDLRITSRAA